MFSPANPVSSYLKNPHPYHSRTITWNVLRYGLVNVLQLNPNLLSRSLVALIIWCTCVATLQGALSITNPRFLFYNGQLNPTHPTIKSSNLADVVHAAVLPGGPSGQMLPPGSLSPDRTYPNHYAHGQCTWYVAGRREIPSNWGNAVSWYYHAVASGWSVGSTPAVAAIAWTPSGRYGHVALVEQVSADGLKVNVSEMNYRGVGVKSSRWVPANQFKYIY